MEVSEMSANPRQRAQGPDRWWPADHAPVDTLVRDLATARQQGLRTLAAPWSRRRRTDRRHRAGTGPRPLPAHERGAFPELQRDIERAVAAIDGVTPPVTKAFMAAIVRVDPDRRTIALIDEDAPLAATGWIGFDIVLELDGWDIVVTDRTG